MERIYLLIVALLVYSSLFSQISITGELRPRAEFRDGYLTLRGDNSDPAFFVSQRNRLNLSYNSEKYSAFIAFQDVRVWGDEKFNAYNPSVALHETWAKLYLSENWTLKVGRQTINLDNKRIFSEANWNQTSKKHDAARLSFKNDSWSIDFINAFNQASENTFGTDYTNGLGNYKYLSTLWVSKSIKNAKLQAFVLFDGFQHSADTVYSRFTSGAIVQLSRGSFSCDARVFGQGGKLVSGQEVSSFLINLEGRYKYQKSIFTLGGELLSGNNSRHSDGKSHTFEMPYGAKHAFNGSMDYFKKSSETKNSGLVDGYLKWVQKLNDKTTLMIDYHCFSSAVSYLVADVEYGKYLASELDFTLKKSIAKSMSFECGYSCLKGSSSLQIMKGGNAARFSHWAYMMLTFKPVFL